MKSSTKCSMKIETANAICWNSFGLFGDYGKKNQCYSKTKTSWRALYCRFDKQAKHQAGKMWKKNHSKNKMSLITHFFGWGRHFSDIFSSNECLKLLEGFRFEKNYYLVVQKKTRLINIMTEVIMSLVIVLTFYKLFYDTSEK